MFTTQKKSPYVFNVEEADFEEKVIKASSQQPVLVDFWADWCAPCLSLAPALESAINGFEGAILLGKVEVDDNMRLAGHFKLKGFPTVVIFHQGEEIARFAGSRAKHWIVEWIEEHLRDYLATR